MTPRRTRPAAEPELTTLPPLTDERLYQLRAIYKSAEMRRIIDELLERRKASA